MECLTLAVMDADQVFPFSNRGPEQIQLLAEKWGEALQDIHHEEIQLGFDRWMRQEERFPTPAGLRRMVEANRKERILPASMRRRQAIEEPKQTTGRMPALLRAAREQGYSGFEAVNVALRMLREEAA
jgi:hypothetical protein